LESRRVLATVLWDGGGDDDLWHNPVNWEGDSLPASSDDVRISTEHAVRIDADVGVRSITVERGALLATEAAVQVEQELLFLEDSPLATDCTSATTQR
jgi:hypothetical protein